jgi:hypothetical protein
MDKSVLDGRVVYQSSHDLQGISLMVVTEANYNLGDFTRSQTLLRMALFSTAQKGAQGATTTGILA